MSTPTSVVFVAAVPPPRRRQSFRSLDAIAAASFPSAGMKSEDPAAAAAALLSSPASPARSMVAMMQQQQQQYQLANPSPMSSPALSYASSFPDSTASSVASSTAPSLGRAPTPSSLAALLAAADFRDAASDVFHVPLGDPSVPPVPKLPPELAATARAPSSTPNYARTTRTLPIPARGRDAHESSAGVDDSFLVPPPVRRTVSVGASLVPIPLAAAAAAAGSVDAAARVRPSPQNQANKPEMPWWMQGGK
ncbi:hypothetical protein HK405_006543 [Cladochytrium tenue]|nr:hypothetical protein HK405_006543 [Cladochytrium tenue]